MNRLIASVYKEWLLLARDWHGLLVLFVMPALFVLIMSLALQGQFAQQGSVQLKGWLSSEGLIVENTQAEAFVSLLREQPELELRVALPDAPLSSADRLFQIHILSRFDAALAGEGDVASGVEVRFAPELGQRERALVEAALQRSFADFNTGLIAAELGFDRDYAQRELLRTGFIQTLEDNSDAHETRPNAVQQNVPAWLIFGMFFIAIPFSTTVIQERQQKTLMRLQSCGMPLAQIYLGKLVPYCLINLLQLGLMLAIGALLLPLAGAQALSLDVSHGALALIGVSTSFAALGWACLVAASSRTIEQATVLSGASCIIFAALGGIMVPRFIMPPLMQDLSLLSPMAWALEGFLTVLVRGGGCAAVALHSLLLVALGGALALIAIFISRWKHDHD
jgi:ABC-2 type transport system permease protein